MELVPIGLLALLVVSFIQGAWARRRAFDLRIQILDLLELATRRGLPFEPLLRKGALGEGRHTRRVLTALARDLEQGEHLSEALASSAPDSFPARVRAAIAAGEGSAQLNSVLASLIEQTDESIALHHRLAMALVYPLALGLGVVFAQELIIHTYAASAATFGNPTVDWFSISGWFSGPGIRNISPWAMFATGVTLTLLVFHRAWRSIPLVRRMISELLATLPWRSRAGRNLEASRFLWTLSHVVAAGQPLPAAMRCATGAVGSPRMERDIRAAASALTEGRPPADAWRLAGLPEFALASITAASRSESDQLAVVLKRTALACRERFVTARERLMDLLHPIGVILFGLLLALDFAVLMSLSAYCREAMGLW